MYSHSKGHDGDGHANHSKDSESPNKRKLLKYLKKEAHDTLVKDEVALALNKPLTGEPFSTHKKETCLEEWGVIKANTHLVQVPEGACSLTEYAVLTIIKDLRSLQLVGSVEPLDWQAFVEKITVTLDGWHYFFSPYFTEEIKQLIARLKVLKQAIKKDVAHWRHTINGLSERTEQADELVEEAKLVIDKQFPMKSSLEVDVGRPLSQLSETLKLCLKKLIELNAHQKDTQEILQRKWLRVGTISNSTVEAFVKKENADAFT